MEDLFGVPMNYIMWVLLALFLPGLGVICVMALRNPVMLKMGLRNIPRRKGQTALIIVGIMISTLIMSASFGTGDTLTYSIRKAVVDGLGTIDEIILSARVDEGGQLGVASYVPIESFYQMQQELAGNDDIDGLAPGVADFAPALNNRTGVSFGRMQIAGVDPVTLQAFGGFRLSDGSPVRVETLEEAQVFLNERGAKELEAQAGDTLTVYVYGESTQLSVKGVVADGGAAGTDPTALLRLDSAQRLFGREAQINSVVVSNRGDELSGAKLSDDVTETLRVMFTDREVAAQLKTSLARDDVLAALAERQERLGLAQSVRDDLAALQVELQSPGLSDQFVSLISDEALREELLETLGGMDDVQLAREVNTLIVDLAEFTVLDIKKDLLEVADQVGSIVTTFFILMGLFSIMVGILLIFLIFVMLAAARRSEMGMARAIGAKRGDLVQMFVFEGASYSVVSGAVGVVLGLIASALIVTVVNRIFAGGGSGADDFQLTRHFEVRSVIVAYCLGMVVTFITVGVSAYRVSRLNIVAAVRDLPTPIETSNASTVSLLLGLVRPWVRPFRLLGRSAAAMFARSPLRSLRLLLLSGWAAGTAPVAFIVAMVLLLWRPFTQGWLALVIGVLLAWSGTMSDSAAWVRIGVSLSIIGIGLTVRLVLLHTGAHRDTADRIGYTLLGVVVLAFWVVPFSMLRSVFGELNGGFEMFFISGVVMVAAAVWTVMYNADLLLKGLTALTGRFGQMRPVLVTAVAYPMSAKFRTGLTLAMFALVIFTMIVMSILTDAFGTTAADPRTIVGGWDIHASVNVNNPIPDIRKAIEEDPDLNIGDFEAIGSYTSVPVRARQLDGEEQSWRGYSVRAVDDEFLDNYESELQLIADGYGDTDEEVWEALRRDPALVVVDSFAVPTRAGFRDGEQVPPFQLEGIYYEDEEMTAIDIEALLPGTDIVVPLKVIGVLDSLSENFGTLGSGMIISRSGLAAVTPVQIPTTNYRFRVASGVDAAQISKDLDTAFLPNGLESRPLAELVEESVSANQSFNYLLTGFMGLGLLVGIAALGVISLRAVVERRQQIGVLRAIGYRRRLVQLSFLTESSFVVLLGVAIGVGLGTVISYLIVREIRTEIETIRFSFPWLQIVIIIAVAYIFSLATTFLPARQASRIYPAEALRYE